MNLQNELTLKIAPLVVLELRSQNATNLIGNDLILNYDEDTQIISIIDKSTLLPIMLAKFIGFDEKGNVNWQPQSLPALSPGLSLEHLNLFLEIERDLLNYANLL